MREHRWVLSPYRVVDLTDERGHLCGYILAALGAEVIAVEPPGGSRARQLGPFIDGASDPERSLTHFAYNRGKRSVVLDLSDDAGRARFRSLLSVSDVVITSDRPGWPTTSSPSPATAPSFANEASSTYPTTWSTPVE